MYYFGTNLDNRFAVTNFWPRPEECNKVPRDRDEVKAEYERIVARRRAFMAEDEAQRARRAAAENRGGGDS
ncbi:hypothetical protein HIM_01776 [Hirsutella minnesotensis 3608]|nr:hypothetical protein HIM_01776 [Hirsutella minnesotensis 3608]